MSVEPPRSGPGTTGPGQRVEGRAAPYQPNEPTGYASEGRSGQLVPTGGDEATGELVLVLTPQPGSKFRGMVTPVVTINGWPVPAHWDANVLTAPAGRHRIQVGMRYLWTQAPIEFDADVTVGQQTVVHYTGPWSPAREGQPRVHPAATPRCHPPSAASASSTGRAQSRFSCRHCSSTRPCFQ